MITFRFSYPFEYTCPANSEIPCSIVPKWIFYSKKISQIGISKLKRLPTANPLITTPAILSRKMKIFKMPRFIERQIEYFNLFNSINPHFRVISRISHQPKTPGKVLSKPWYFQVLHVKLILILFIFYSVRLNFIFFQISEFSYGIFWDFFFENLSRFKIICTL